MKCVNLCDLLDKKVFSSGSLERLFQMPQIADAERICAGSYFCSQYFLEMDFLQQLEQFVRQHDLSLTLVVPIISEKDLLAAKQKLDDLLRQLPVDEVTVNDVGMLSFISDTYRITLNLGRLFFKDARDIRMRGYYQRTVHPAGLDRLEGYAKRFSVGCAELDAVSSCLQLGSDIHTPIAIHYPYCYMTTGNICKYASIDKDISKKFRPNAPCSRQCQRIYETYSPKTGEYTLYRIGRAVYFETQLPETVDGQFERLIYFPLRELTQLRKEGDGY